MPKWHCQSTVYCWEYALLSALYCCNIVQIVGYTSTYTVNDILFSSDSSHTWQGVDQVKEYQSHYQLSSILKSEISSHNKKKFSEKKEEKPAEKGRRKAKKEKVAEMKSPPSIFSATPHDAPFQKQKMSVPLKEKTTVSMKEPVKSLQEQELAASSRERIESSLIDDLKKPELLSEAKKTEKSDSSDEEPRYKPKEMSEEMKQDLLRLLKTKDEKQKLEAMAVKKKWTKAADVEDTEVPHKQMRSMYSIHVHMWVCTFTRHNKQ